MDESSYCSFPVIKISSKLNFSTRLDDNLDRSDEITVLNPEIEAITKITRDSKNKTVLSVPSKFPVELFPTKNLINESCQLFHAIVKLSRNLQLYLN